MQHKRWFPVLVLIVAAAGLYLLTLDNGLRPEELAGGDLITHQYAQVQGRPSNAPGYPLYTMGGWLWFRLGRVLLGPAANPIPILSAYSTLWALLALWLLYALTCDATDRGDGGNRPVALLTTGFYAVTYFFWYYAVTTEEYTSAVAWTVAVLWLAFRWQRVRRDAYLYAMAFLVGVGLAHIVTVLFIVPPLLCFILREQPQIVRRPRLIARAAGLAALPLLSYVFVYVRGAQHPEWRGAGQWSSAWQWFWSFLSTQQGRSELTWSWTPFLTPEFPHLILDELTAPVLLLGLLGLAYLGRRRAVMIYVTLAIYLAFCWLDRRGNWFQVIMPAYALVVLGLGAFAGRLWTAIPALSWPAPSRSTPALGDGHPAPPVVDRAPELPDRGRGARPARSLLLRGGVLVLLAVLLLARAASSYPRANGRDRAGDTGLAPGWAILADDPPAGTAVLGTLPETLALNYLTAIWGVRQDVRTVTSEQLRTLLEGGASPLAVTSAALPLVAQEVSPQAHYSAMGRTLVALSRGPAVARTTPISGVQQQSWGHDFGDGMRLTSGWIGRDAGSGETVVWLEWQAQARPSQDWSVSVRLTRGEAELAQEDRRHPVDGAYPTGRWTPGETVGDAYRFRTPDAANATGLLVILYRSTGEGRFENLGLARLAIAGAY